MAHITEDVNEVRPALPKGQGGKDDVERAPKTPTPTATPVADPAPSAKPVVAKKVTITCMKGKTVKKVTAVKPVCPAGFKKK